MDQGSAYAELVALLRDAVPEHAEELIERIGTELGAETLKVPARRSIELSDSELLGLHRAHGGDARLVAQSLNVSKRQVLNRLAWIVRRRY